MDASRRYLPSFGDDVPLGPRPRPRAELPAGIEGLEKVLRFSVPPQPSTGPGSAEAAPPREREPVLSARDVAQALDLVHQAAQGIRASEERAREGEARMQALLQRATDELTSAEARMHAAEGRARAAEARAAESEGRAREAENWLRQIFATISQELPGPR